MPLQHPGLDQRHRQVESGLPAQGREEGVRPLADNDRLDRLNGQGLDVHSIGNVLVGHDRGRVGVDENRLHPLLAERLASLGPRIVEFSGLTDHNRARADDQDLSGPLSGCQTGDHLKDTAPSCDLLQEAVEKMLIILRPRATLGVVLDGEDRQRTVGDSLDRAVIEVQLTDVEVTVRNRQGVDPELMVLTGDMDQAGVEVLDRVVGAVVTEGQPRGRPPDRLAENLVAKADAEERDPPDRAPAELDRRLKDRWVPGTVGEEEPVGAAADHILQTRRMRQQKNPRAPLAERPQRSVFDAVVEHRNREPGGVEERLPPIAAQFRGQRVIPFSDRRAGDKGDEVLLRERFHRRGQAAQLGEALTTRGFGLVREHRSQRTVGSQMKRQCPGVDATDPRHSLGIQILMQRGGGGMVTGSVRLPADD